MQLGKREPNDLLIVKMLGIKSVYVYFENIEAGLESREGVYPHDATVYVADLDGMTRDQVGAVQLWVAQKTGIQDWRQINVEEGEIQVED